MASFGQKMTLTEFNSITNAQSSSLFPNYHCLPNVITIYYLSIYLCIGLYWANKKGFGLTRLTATISAACQPV